MPGSPDRDHAQRCVGLDLLMKEGKLVDPLHRLADRRVQAEQDPLQHKRRHAECHRSHHDRLAGLVLVDTPRLRPRNRKDALKLAGEQFAVVPERCGFQAIAGLLGGGSALQRAFRDGTAVHSATQLSS